MATEFAQRSHHTGPFQKVLTIDGWKSRMIGLNVFFPLFDERQWGRFLDFLQHAINESRQLSKSVVNLICCNEIIGNWNRNMCHRYSDIDCAHPWCIKCTRKKTRNHKGAELVCSQGTTSKFPWNHYVPPAKHTRQQYMGLLTDFKKKMQQTELHSRYLVHIEVPVNSLLLKQNTAQWMRVWETAPTRPKRGRTYHKTIPIVFASRLFQVGDNQGPNADDVGNNVDKMWHTQVVGQDGLFQSGTRGHPITRLSTFQPIHNEFGPCEQVQTPEHTGRCPL